MIQFRPTGAGAGPSEGRCGQPSRRRRRSLGVTQRVRVHPLSRYGSSTAAPLSRRRSCRRNPLSSSAPYPLSSSADGAVTPCRVLRPDGVPLVDGLTTPCRVGQGAVSPCRAWPPALFACGTVLRRPRGRRRMPARGDGDFSSLPRLCAVTVRTEGRRVERRSSRWCAAAPHRGVRTRAHRPGRLGAPPGGGRCATACGPHHRTAPPHRRMPCGGAVRAPLVGAPCRVVRTPCRRSPCPTRGVLRRRAFCLDSFRCAP